MDHGKSADGADTLVLAIAHEPVATTPTRPCAAVINRMAEMGLTSLPVVRRENTRQLLGNITLRDMLKARMHSRTGMVWRSPA